MIKAIIFDCFGVLVSDALEVLCNEVAATNPEAAGEIRALVRASNKGLIEPTDSNKQIAELFGVSLEAFQERIKDGEIKNDRLLDYIRQLRTHYKTAVLSNISASGLAKRFSEQELAECFDTVVSSGQIGYAKPEAEAYEIVAERLGVRLDECVFTDDRADFCDAARAVGMQAIEFSDFEQFKRELEQLLAAGE